MISASRRCTSATCCRVTHVLCASRRRGMALAWASCQLSAYSKLPVSARL